MARGLSNLRATAYFRYAPWCFRDLRQARGEREVEPAEELLHGSRRHGLGELQSGAAVGELRRAESPLHVLPSQHTLVALEPERPEASDERLDAGFVELRKLLLDRT